MSMHAREFKVREVKYWKGKSVRATNFYVNTIILFIESSKYFSLNDESIVCLVIKEIIVKSSQTYRILWNIHLKNVE